MKANELRIGNYLTDEWNQSVNVIDSISERGANLYIEDDGNWAEISQTWIEANISNDEMRPITLNADWLISLGFERENDEPFNWSDKKKYLSDCFLIGSYSDGLHYVRNGLKTGKPLIHVHQLQNLYFALTGEELVRR